MTAKLRGRPTRQVVDPAVSRAKFARELSVLRRHETEYAARGWLLLRAEFPTVVLLLGAPHLKPSPLLFGVRIDYTNYDAEAPSVTIMNPWTGEPVPANQLLTTLPRLVRVDDSAAAQGLDAAAAGAAPQPRFELKGLLLQWWEPTDTPFLCIRGVREYHRHPAHTGDAWLMHRGRGEGRMLAIMDAIHAASVALIQTFHYDVILHYPPDAHPTVEPIGVEVNAIGFVYGLPR